MCFEYDKNILENPKYNCIRIIRITFSHPIPTKVPLKSAKAATPVSIVGSLV